MLWSELSGPARDCAHKIPKKVLLSENGAKAVLTAVHCHDLLFIISSIYSDFSAASRQTGSANNESLKAFEGRFEAAVCRFRYQGDEKAVPEPLPALMLFQYDSSNGQ